MASAHFVRRRDTCCLKTGDQVYVMKTKTVTISQFLTTVSMQGIVLALTPYDIERSLTIFQNKAIRLIFDMKVIDNVSALGLKALLH